MKKVLKFVLLAGVIAGLVFGGLKFLDVVTYDYLKVVNDAMVKFYTSADKDDLDPITLLLDEYSEDLEKVDYIQDEVDKNVEQWIDYLKGKYLCNSTNANACSVQLQEMENLLIKVETLGEVESDFGDKVITPRDYEKRMEEIEKYIKTAKDIVESESSTSPKSEIEKQKEKCASLGASSCEKCDQRGMCECVYVHNGGRREDLQCYKPDLAKK